MNKNQLLDEIAELIGAMVLYEVRPETRRDIVKSKLIARRSFLDPADYCEACYEALAMLKKAEAWS